MDVNDLELTTKPAMVDNHGLIVTNFKQEMIKKKNEYAIKRKTRLTKLYAPIKFLLSLRSKSFLFLSPCFMPTFVPVFMLVFMPVFVSAHLFTPVSCLGSCVVLSSGCMPVPAVCVAFFLSCHAFVSCCGISALLSSLLLLSPRFSLGLSYLRTFQQFFSDEPWPHVSISPTKSLCLFRALGVYNPDNDNGLYNPTNNNKYKWGFNTIFINSCPLASNHDQKEVDLSFAGCECPAIVKLNQSR